MCPGAVQNGLFYEVSATTRGICAAGSIRTPGGVHPVYSSCPARGVAEASAICRSLVIASVWKLLDELVWMEL